MFLKLHRTMRILPITFLVMFVLSLAVPPVFAGNHIEVKEAWAPATAPNAPNATAYMVLHNSGDQADELVSAKSPLAKKVSLHKMSMKNGMMKMHPVKSIPVPAHGMTALKSGGYHLMIMGPKKHIADGSMFEVTLTFKNAGEIKVHVPVQKGKKSGRKMDMKMGH